MEEKQEVGDSITITLRDEDGNIKQEINNKEQYGKLKINRLP